MKWIEDLRTWLAMRAFVRDLNELGRHDWASLKVDLQHAVELLEESEVRDAESSPCSGDNYRMEALHLVRSAIGLRVKPAPYEHYARKIPFRHFFFGYLAPSGPATVGLRAAVRMCARQSPANPDGNPENP